MIVLNMFIKPTTRHRRRQLALQEQQADDDTCYNRLYSAKSKFSEVAVFANSLSKPMRMPDM